MPVEVNACRNIELCLRAIGPCFCCNKGYEGDPDCIKEGNPNCLDYRKGLAFDAAEIERLERNVIYN